MPFSHRAAKLSSCWSKWHQISYHQHCGHSRAHT